MAFVGVQEMLRGCCCGGTGTDTTSLAPAAMGWLLWCAGVKLVAHVTSRGYSACVSPSASLWSSDFWRVVGMLKLLCVYFAP